MGLEIRHYITAIWCCSNYNRILFLIDSFTVEKTFKCKLSHPPIPAITNKNVVMISRFLNAQNLTPNLPVIFAFPSNLTQQRLLTCNLLPFRYVLFLSIISTVAVSRCINSFCEQPRATQNLLDCSLHIFFFLV